jgi:O-antigen/teichoic acid export membrane protein
MSNFSSLLVKGTLWKFLLYASSYVLNICIAHKLKAGQTGNFYYLINNLSIAIFFLSFGIDSAINYFNTTKKIENGKLLGIAVLWPLLASTLFWIGYLALARLSIVRAESSLLYFFLFVAGSLLTAMISSLFISSNDSATPSYIPALLNLLLITIVLTQKEGIKYLWPVYSLITGFTGLALLWAYFAKTRHRFALKNIPAKKILRYSSLAFLSNIFINLLLRADYWLVKAMSSDTALGNYIMTSKFSQLIVLVPSLLSFTLFPLITQRITDKKDTDEKIKKLISLFFYQSLVLCVLISSIGYWLFPLLYGETFDKMFWTFILLIPGMLFLSASYPITPYFAGTDANKILIKSAFYGLVIMILLDLVLIPRYSIYGAALASSCGYIIYFLGLFYEFKKHFRYKLFSLFDLQFAYTTCFEIVNQYKKKLKR